MVLWNAIVTLFVNSQTKSKARRGKAAANNAKMQPKHMMDTPLNNSIGGHIQSSAEFLCLVMPFVHFITLSIHLTFCTAENSIIENRWEKQM